MHAGSQRGRGTGWGGTAEPRVVVPSGLSSSCLLKHPRTPEGLELTTSQRSTSSAFTPYVLKMRTEHLPSILPFLSSLSQRSPRKLQLVGSVPLSQIPKAIKPMCCLTGRGEERDRNSPAQSHLDATLLGLTPSLPATQAFPTSAASQPLWAEPIVLRLYHPPTPNLWPPALPDASASNPPAAPAFLLPHPAQ